MLFLLAYSCFAFLWNLRHPILGQWLGLIFFNKCVSSFFLFSPFMTLVSTTSEVKLRGSHDFIQNWCLFIWCKRGLHQFIFNYKVSSAARWIFCNVRLQFFQGSDWNQMIKPYLQLKMVCKQMISLVFTFLGTLICLWESESWHSFQ